MSQQPPPNERIIRQRLEQASALAKKGQYQKARYILKDIQSDRRAAKLMKQMDGRKDKLQGGISYFYSGTIVAIVGIGLILLFWLFGGAGNIQEGLQEQADLNATFGERGLEGNREFYIDLVQFCYDRVDGFPDSCIDWAELVFTEYAQNVYDCVFVSPDGIEYRSLTFDQAEACYREGGIPDVPQLSQEE